MKLKHKFSDEVFDAEMFDGENMPHTKQDMGLVNGRPYTAHMMELTAPSGELVVQDVVPGTMILISADGHKHTVHDRNLKVSYEDYNG